MSYSATKFEVATSYCLGGDTFTRNVTDAHPHGRTSARTHRRTDRRTTDRLWYEINIPFFSKEKSGYNKADTSDTEATFLDLHLFIANDIVSAKIDDNRDDFDFEIVNFPFLDGDVPRFTSMEYISLN